jgi:dTDP-4-amino-4,6-dideoxygalactose transaminase
MIPYSRQHIEQDDIEAVIQVLSGDWLTIGPEVDRFERNLTEYVGAPTTVVSSGTAALHAAYKAINLTEGDEIITPPLTFIATQATASLLGADVKFADIELSTGNIDFRQVEQHITKKTRAIVAVDYAGHPADLNELRSISEAYGVVLIEDAAHSIGSLYKGQRVGSIADLTTFSFFSTKNITTAEGGALSARDPKWVEKARRFTHQGLVRNPDEFLISTEGPWHQEVHEFCLNYLLPDVLCAMGISQLAKIEKFKLRRQEIFNRYNEAFVNLPKVTVPTHKDFVEPMWHLYPVRVPADLRREIFIKLRHLGIGVQVNYLPAYRHPAFNKHSSYFDQYPNTEKYYSEEISLPINAHLLDEDIDFVIDVFSKIMAKI